MTPEQAAEKIILAIPSHALLCLFPSERDDLETAINEAIHAQRAEAVAEHLSNPIEQLKKVVVDAAIVWQTTWHDKGMKAAEILQGYLYDRVRHLVKAMNPPEQEGEG